ncbi:ABC transporter related protein [Methanohalobium evestigatum Z-7303]|uniref:Cobalamin import ATP-binding protein BtuD n=1 Tax=Methanohalobium evestigatum (strain ATCC BAA-1072 / DSM 3721 / NBRC 107634 / OCM 161 / Z-7303) TaxID=644295 RepID=D7EBS2_METEZ|nr:ABC transporter ATP-binding protein [Methanohalobium evestigatum]ADI74914.1 ABC transporter related protein [Methanohalobium evestigatum Z-7303]
MGTYDNAVELSNVWVHYGNIPVLEDINLTIEQPRDLLAIIGPNGGGKTTLLKVILGLIKPSNGKVKLFGESPAKNRKYVGYVPQHSSFDYDFPISVWDVVLMGRMGHTGILKRYSSEDKFKANKALKTVNMEDYANHQIGKLSGGQRQRVFIARALAAEPEVLLLDEPSAGLDTHMQGELYELLSKLKKDMAIIMVTHDLTAVSLHVDKVACLNRKLFYHGSKEISHEDLEAAYHCPVEMIAHGVPHRVLKDH